MTDWPDVPYATGVVHHDAIASDGSVEHHRQTFEAGRLVDWERDVMRGPWALVRQVDAAEIPAADHIATTSEVGSTHVRIGDQIIPLPPVDDLESAEMRATPLVPDASLHIRLQLTSTPVGTMFAELASIDGRRSWGSVVDEWATEETTSGLPTIEVTLTWRSYLRMRAGELNSLEAVEEGGNVGGRWTVLLLLHGLVQSPPIAAVYRALPKIPDELSWWGEVAQWTP